MNECALDNGGCGTTCVNSPGSFHCKCDSGYELDSNNKTCTGETQFAHISRFCQTNYFSIGRRFKILLHCAHTSKEFGM